MGESKALIPCFVEGATADPGAVADGWKEPRMDDQEVIDRINQLAHEEHELFEKESEGTIGREERERLQWLQVGLDQCWDLLHQRRALRSAGRDPNEAKPRDEKTVEGYVG
jgi:hypothetical protein